MFCLCFTQKGISKPLNSEPFKISLRLFNGAIPYFLASSIQSAKQAAKVSTAELKYRKSRSTTGVIKPFLRILFQYNTAFYKFQIKTSGFETWRSFIRSASTIFLNERTIPYPPQEINTEGVGFQQGPYSFLCIRQHRIVPCVLHQTHAANDNQCCQSNKRINCDAVEHGFQSGFLEVGKAGIQTNGSQCSDH